VTIATTSTTTIIMPVATSSLVATTTYYQATTSTTTLMMNKFYFYWLGNKESTLASSSPLKYDEFNQSNTNGNYVLDNYSTSTKANVYTATSTWQNINSWVGVRGCPTNCQTSKQRFSFTNLKPNFGNYLYLYIGQKFGSFQYKLSVVSGSMSPVSQASVGNGASTLFIPYSTSLIFDLESATTTVDNYFTLDAYEIDLRKDINAGIERIKNCCIIPYENENYNYDRIRKISKQRPT
jgi:hypothetical protein